MTLPNFSTDGPPLGQCDLCGKGYQEWEVKLEEWKLLPQEYLPLMLCEDDFRRLLSDNGHDPSRVKITHESWRWLLAAWEESKDAPPHYTKILFNHEADEDAGGETMWCEVLEDLGKGRFKVRLQNDSLFDDRLSFGVEFLAEWDGMTVHGISGRPVLRPVRRLGSAARGRRRPPRGKKRR